MSHVGSGERYRLKNKSHIQWVSKEPPPLRGCTDIIKKIVKKKDDTNKIPKKLTYK